MYKRQDLQSRNERMFLVTALFLNTAKTKQALDNAIFQTAGIAQKYNCVLKRLDYQQEEGLMSSVPLGVNHIPIKRALTTTSTAIFVPFTTQELFMAGESLYYGLKDVYKRQATDCSKSNRGRYTSPALAFASYPFVDLPSGDTLRCKLFPADKFYRISFLSFEKK